MLRDIADGRVQSVVAWANDRLYRNVQDQLDLLKAVKEAGGLIATVKDGEVDPSTAEGAMRMGILANVAEFESKRKSERLLRKHEELASAGRWSGGPRPFGYDRDANGRLTVVVPSEASAIRDAAERILNGEALRL